MIRINIHEAKTHLSRYLLRLKGDDRILICKRNVPIAELRALPSESRTARPFGLAKGLFEVPDDFNAPLPEDEVERWYGG
jgi:antitoxin (DNA-binding transcriptional repressor) of toxin-antitoxin stability system